MRHMVEEMKGLRCGTNTDTAYVIDDTASEESDVEDKPATAVTDASIRTDAASESSISHGTTHISHGTIQPVSREEKPEPSSTDVTCSVCTTIHTPPLPICCETCNNVLQPNKLSNDKIWRCTAPGCQGANLGYSNFQDAGRCGICGSKRESGGDHVAKLY
jgi:hypothetical protein